MRKKTIYVGIVNLKGGTGKSVLTTVIASILHYTYERTVAIIDGDNPQYSIYTMRERDLKMVESNNYYKNLFKKQFERIQKKAYPVRKSDPKNIIETAETVISQYPDTNIIFFDLSGSTSAEGILSTILNLDYIFCPLMTDRIVMESSFSFVTTIKEWSEQHEGTYPLKDNIYMFWNKINNRESKMLYNVGNRIMKELGVKKMKSEIPDTSKFKKELSASREIFRSTLFPPNKSLLQGVKLEVFIEEFCRIIKI